MKTARRRNRSQILRAREVWAAYSRTPSASIREIFGETGYTLGKICRCRRLLRRLGWIDFVDGASRATLVRVPLVNMGDGARWAKP